MSDFPSRDDPATPSKSSTGAQTSLEADADQLARKASELARKSAEFQVLQRVSSEINSTLDLDEICDVALRTMDDLFEFHHAIILLLEPDGEMLQVAASRGYENQATGGRVRIGTGVVGVVAQKRKMLHVNNLGQQRAYAAAQRRQLMRAGRTAELGDTVPVPGLFNAESQIAIPLIIRDELIGVFSIETPVRRTFTEHERGLVSIVANQIASAIRNAQLYEERRRAADALQAANASLEARVAERTAALERELQVAEELLSDARARVEGPLIGDSASVCSLREAVEREAARTGPLLLIGPPGAGKEAVAHELHSASRRAGAFIFVRCPELHTTPRHTPAERNASTQPELARKLELAVGGTLFLEGVHELPLGLQQSLGPLLEQHSDVRVIASTTRDLSRDVLSGRIDTVFLKLFKSQIQVPALVDRVDDLPALVNYFVRTHARQLGKVIDGVSPESMRRLEAYTWPGNIRELRTVLERAILVSRSTVLEVDEDLLDETFAVGSYQLVTRLGSGGMGEVWLAKHRLLARPAAVKLIRHDVVQPGSEHEELVRRFEREAQVTSDLRSPHTVQLYDFGVNDSGSFFYVMELLEGLDLDQIVSRFGPQPASRVIMLLRQACRSLTEAHERGLVHRDIKPANLFVTRLGAEYDYLKVLDFGIVKDPLGQAKTMLSSQGVLQGTPAFMAPELIRGESPLDGRSDLYALACTAYLTLTGRLVFEANTPGQMLLHHVQTPPQPLSQALPGAIPAQLEAIVMKCLEKDPARRVGSAQELEAQLARVPCETWTQDKAREWWETHAPERVSRRPG